jgi:AcrR family transcriptional regulator
MEQEAPKGATRRSGRPARLSRDMVLRAALEVADVDGIEALTMRRIGQQLGSEAMSLYRHVENKDEVLDGIVDLVYSEIDVPAGPDWKAAMRGRAMSAREALIRHPWAVSLMESRSRPGPANLRHHDAVLAVLLGAGFSGPTATHAYNLLDSYIYGFAIQETTLPMASDEPLAEDSAGLVEQIPADEYPHLVRVSSELIGSGFVYADEFEYGLDLILDAIERTVAATSGGET